MAGAPLADRAGAPITLRQLEQCCRRELSWRNKVYPTRVSKGTLSQREADRQVDLMRTAADHFKALADAEDAKTRLL